MNKQIASDGALLPRRSIVISAGRPLPVPVDACRPRSRPRSTSSRGRRSSSSTRPSQNYKRRCSASRTSSNTSSTRPWSARCRRRPVAGAGPAGGLFDRPLHAAEARGVHPARAPDAGHLVPRCPWYIIFSRLNLMDSYVALVLSAHADRAADRGLDHVRPTSPAIPRELEESALVDGATRQYAFLGHHPADLSGPGNHHRDHALLHLFLEQLHVLPGPQSMEKTRRRCRSRSTTSSPTPRSTGAA